MIASDSMLDKQTAGTLSGKAVLARLECSAQGLSYAQVQERRVRFGQNHLLQERTTALRVLLRQFQSVLVYFLLIAAVLSFVTGDISDGVIIAVILILNAALGFSQEYRSERAVEQLSHLISTRTLVTRGDKAALVDVGDLVPGDVVTLKEGDIVPADLKLLTAVDVQTNESQLTGESQPVTKIVAEGDNRGGSSLLFAGSTMDRGEATAVVYAIGSATQLGKIATLSAGVHKVTQYEKSLRAFSSLLLKVIVISLSFTLVIKLLLGGPVSNISLLLIFVIALAVAVVPEALPVVATLTLSRGALRLVREKVVVKRLSSLEDLGNVSMLCTDKTGTLTQNKLTVENLVSDDPELFQTLAYASIDRSASTGTGTQSSFDSAFEAFVPDDVKRQSTSYKLLKELPFDPASRRRRVLLQDSASGACYLVVIGQPQTLLEIASCRDAARYRHEMDAEGAEGLRHLAIAYRPIPNPSVVDLIEAETVLTFLGFVALADPLRPDAAQTIDTARQLGVAIKILTGDSPEVAGYVGRQVGLAAPGGQVYTGEQLSRMPADEWDQAVRDCNIFARVSPEQKFDIIKALKTHEIVGYQGDGINDAPALKLADVAIAVDSATDVAKASADIILLDKDLGVVINAIRYGRTIFANINKYIKYTMVGNFGNFFALVALYLLSSSLPLLPRQVLLVSLLTDVPLVAISTDRVSASELEQPDKYNAHALLLTSLVLGTLTALFELAFFATLHHIPISTSRTSLYLFLLLTQLVVIVTIRNREHFWKAVPPSLPLLAGMILTACVGLALVYVPFTARIFAFSSLSWMEVGKILAVAAVYVLALDFVKVWYYRVSEGEAGRLRPLLLRDAVAKTP